MRSDDPPRPGERVSWTRREFIASAGAGLGVVAGVPSLVDARPGHTPEGNPPLDDWAIVVGINQTTNADPMTWSVNSAVRFVNWLIEHRRVAPGRIFLLTSPFPAAPVPPPDGRPVPQVPAGIIKRGATLEDLTGTIEEIADKPVAPSRLFFFFSGHGVAFQAERGRGFDLDSPDGLVPCDFKPGVRKALSLSWAMKYLQFSCFVEQYYFIDACRNIQHKNTPHEGSQEFPQAQAPGQETTFYILYATPPGHKTIASTGGFPDTLLDGLSGVPGALKYDGAADRYLVRWYELNCYLQRYFTDPRRNTIPTGLHGEVIEPKPIVWPGWDLLSSPVLTVIEPAQVGDVTLTLDIEPGRITEDVRIGIFGPKVERSLPPPPVVGSISIPLPPRDYIITVTTGGRVLPPIPLDLMADRKQPVSLGPGLVAPAAAAAPPDQTATLHLESLDPQATIDLVDSSGGLVRDEKGTPHTGLGTMQIPRLEPGLYRARLHAPDGTVSESIVRARPNSMTRVRLRSEAALPPEFLPDSVRLAADMLTKSPNLDIQGHAKDLTETIQINFGEVMGLAPIPPVPGPRSTCDLVAHLVRVADEDRDMGLLLDRSLGLRPFSEGQTGFRFLFLVPNDPDRVPPAPRPVEVRLGPLGDPNGEALQPEKGESKDLIVFTKQAAPGPYRLRIWFEDDVRDYALTLLPRRRCEWHFGQDANGDSVILQFATEAERPPEWRRPWAESSLRASERTVDLQRSMQRRQPVGTRVAALLEAQAREKEADPISLALRTLVSERPLYRNESIPERSERLRNDAQSLLQLAPELPDGHVALAWAAELLGDLGQARREYQAALDRGLPTLMHFTTLLYQGARRLKIEHPRSALLGQVTKRRLLTALWTSWRPELRPD